MTDADVFGKLSRIFETHAQGGDEGDLEDFLEDFEPANSRYDFEDQNISFSPGMSNKLNSSSLSPRKLMFSQSQQSRMERPSPYEIWEDKRQREWEKTKQLRPIPKLSSEQWDRLVSKMHQNNRVKQSAMIKEQNSGLAQELGGYLFKPRINAYSQSLSNTMKPLLERMPEMRAEREKDLESKRKENADQEIVQCTFSPKRTNKGVSDYYLKRSGRKKLNPEDFFKYESERKKRLEMRKAIVTEIQSKELTFRPQISEKSIKLQEKLASKGVLRIDPVTRTAISPSPHSIAYRPKGLASSPDARYEHGPMLIIESDHPYHNNTCEYTTVQVPNAVQYLVTFHEDTRTEPVYDYVKFFADDSHTDYYGAGKYSGGGNGSPSNWPGLGDHPPLVIPASKFVILFKTNDIGNDWGFCMHIVPLLMIQNNLNVPTESPSISSKVPVITEAGQRYKQSEPVHERLFRRALVKQALEHNQLVDLMQTKLNIMLRPYETARPIASSTTLGSSTSPAHSYIKMYSKTHLPKAPLSSFVEAMVLGSEDELLTGTVAARAPVVTTVDFDDAHSHLWRMLRTL
eukprot:gene1878-2054_t